MTINWQKHLDDLYPSGLSVTQIEDVPENVMDSNQFLTPRLLVEVDDPNRPGITCQVFEFEKDISFTLEKLEDFSPGVRIAHTPGDEPDFLLSTNLDETVFRRLRQARKEWYG